jgi:tetratricopeptide (TPR) repeat protein
VSAVKRETTPPGPIADLFDRLDDLHSKAGRPSMREIAIRAGRGNISSSTVHNLFRRSQVPRWAFLEQVVKALGGEQERDSFLSLWEAAWRAENDVAAPRKVAAGVPPPRYPEDRPADPAPRPRPGTSQRRIAAAPWPAHRLWSNEIPSENQNFAGRTAELGRLSSNLFNGEHHIQVISGMGGIGKSELATEYIHRNIDAYEIVWWIRAEHEDRVRDALVDLAQRLDLRQTATDNARDRMVMAVLEALQSDAWSSWLLVFDNASGPLALQRYFPATGPGKHVITTAREPWSGYPATDSIEVSPFTETESISFVRRAVPILAKENRLAAAEDARRDREARRLTTTLGHLPIALGHAAAYLADTGESVEEYLIRFAENAHQLLSEHPTDAELPVPVSGTWAMSSALLTSDAEHLFNLCSFLSPEPIAAELFLQPTAWDLDDPPGLAEIFSSQQRFRTAVNQLHRLSLATVDGARDHIQVHRVVQAVTQGRLRLHSIEAFRAYSAAADRLLARANPGNPDSGSSDRTYNLTLHHLESEHRFLHSENRALRTLIVDQVRRLHLRGGHVEAMHFGQDALQVWRETLGEDDPQVLALSVEVAIAMYVGGRAADAHELILQIRPLLQRYSDGDGFKALLLCENLYGADLRGRSQFSQALELDRSIIGKFEAAYGINHERTLNVRNNIGIDYRQLGHFDAALKSDERTLQARRLSLGPNDIFTLYSENAVARDLRGLGRYQESLDVARQVVAAFDAAGGRENIRWLQACQGFATALRKVGHHSDAVRESEHVLQRFRDYLGVDHMYTLGAAVEVINDMRAVGDLARAEELARQTHEQCRMAKAPDVLMCAVLMNLASVLRAASRPERALPYDEQARKGLIRIHGYRHPFTLAANINYASDLAGCGDQGSAIQLGKETLDRCRLYLGDDHPDTLMAASNLAGDEMAGSEQSDGERRLDDTLRRYERTLTLEHPEARAAAARTRLTAEIEPYDL